MKIEQITESGRYRLDRTSKRGGYVSRKSNGIVRHYDGRWGIGWTIDKPAFDSTRYFWREYWLPNLVIGESKDWIAAAIESQNPQVLFDSISDAGLENLLWSPLETVFMTRLALQLIGA